MAGRQEMAGQAGSASTYRIEHYLRFVSLSLSFNGSRHNICISRFSKPVDYLAYALVRNPGGYHFSDYLKLGLQTTLVVSIIGL